MQTQKAKRKKIFYCRKAEAMFGALVNYLSMQAVNGRVQDKPINACRSQKWLTTLKIYEMKNKVQLTFMSL